MPTVEIKPTSPGRPPPTAARPLPMLPTSAPRRGAQTRHASVQQLPHALPAPDAGLAGLLHESAPLAATGLMGLGENGGQCWFFVRRLRAELITRKFDAGRLMTLARFGYPCFACGIPSASTK